MVFSSTVFMFLFLPVLLLLYFCPCIKKREIKNIILLIFSLLFYAWGEPVNIIIMVISIVVNWFLGILINEKNRKAVMLLATSYNVAILFVFKYFTFATQNIAKVLQNDSIIVRVALPIGISFYTFQMMSYIFDIYYGKAKAQRNLLNVALYISLFPQLIAGPIVRYETIEKEIQCRKETREDFAEGLTRFICGLGKKVLLSNYLAVVADNIFDFNGSISVATAWIGAIAYTFQIYFDFSGYSDMAIGLGRIFGFHFVENFNYPYISKSITEFWRRWHISLSTWFRDYVYIPLGGNRCSKARNLFNLLVVWSLTGFWHGANWTFLLWGLIYFALLVFEKSTNLPQKLNWFGHIYTLFFVVIAWVVFRCESLGMCAEYVKNMFGVKNMLWDEASAYYLSHGVLQLFLVAGFCATPIWCIIVKKLPLSETVKEIFRGAFTILVMVVSILALIKDTYNPFIYFNF